MKSGGSQTRCTNLCCSDLERVLKVPRQPLEADERVLSEKRKAPSSPKKSTFTRIGYVINVTSNIVFQAFKTRSKLGDASPTFCRCLFVAQFQICLVLWRTIFSLLSLSSWQREAVPALSLRHEPEPVRP